MGSVRSIRSEARARVAGLLASLILAACGGGGGDSGDSPGTGHTLGGTIAAADVSVVDSDTNDPLQQNFRANDTEATAQSLVTPVTVVGSVNIAHRGPTDGMNYSWGDEEDWFKVSLKAGQVVELLVGETSVTPANDADLCVFNADGSLAACSQSVGARECVKVTADADFYVVAYEYASVSAYNLRISAPGQGDTCDTETRSASAMVPGQLLAMPAGGNATQDQAPAARRALARRAMQVAGVAVRSASPSSALPVDVLDLPRGRRAHREALTTLRLGMKSRDVAAAHRQAVSSTSSDETSMPDTVALMRYAKTLQTEGGYAAVEPNWIMQRTAALVGTFPPGDVNYPTQRWHYEQIALPSAMATIAALPTAGRTRPLVAVIDDGVLLDHPDLAPQLVGPGRTFSSTTVEGDGDLASGDNAARKSDDSFHGAHVAGTVAAATFDTGANSYGAGVAPMAQILPIRVFGESGSATMLDVAEGIKYAAGLENRSGTRPARRADIINMSLGATSYVACPAIYQSAITAARNAGVLVVVSAGNSARNDRSTPAPVSAPGNCAGTFTVAATDALRKQAFYSSSGSSVLVTAPGGDSGQRANGSGSPDGVYSAWGTFDASGVRRPSFIGIMGTSMAAPHVSGVFALMKYINPALTPDQVQEKLEGGELTEELGAPGKDDAFGWGLINASKAVDAALASLNAPVPASRVIATPSSMDFGSRTTEMVLHLADSGSTTTERVTAVTADSPAVTVAASANVNGSSGLGDYAVRVDRSKLPATTASYFPKVTITLSSGRSLVVQLSLTVLGSSGVAAGGDVGPVYILLIDPATDDVVHTVLATYANGRYTWSYSGYDKARVAVVAGTDLDDDGFLCQRAEVCGGYPVFSTRDSMAIDVTGDRRDIDFSIAPMVGTSAAVSATGLRGAPTANSAGSRSTFRKGTP